MSIWLIIYLVSFCVSMMFIIGEAWTNVKHRTTYQSLIYGPIAAYTIASLIPIFNTLMAVLLVVDFVDRKRGC